MLQWHPRLVALLVTIVLVVVALAGGFADEVIGDNLYW